MNIEYIFKIISLCPALCTLDSVSVTSGMTRKNEPHLLDSYLPQTISDKYGAQEDSPPEQLQNAYVLVEVSQLLQLFERPCRRCYSRQLVPGQNNITVCNNVRLSNRSLTARLTITFSDTWCHSSQCLAVQHMSGIRDMD